MLLLGLRKNREDTHQLHTCGFSQRVRKPALTKIKFPGFSLTLNIIFSSPSHFLTMNIIKKEKVDHYGTREESCGKKLVTVEPLVATQREVIQNTKITTSPQRPVFQNTKTTSRKRPRPLLELKRWDFLLFLTSLGR